MSSDEILTGEGVSLQVPAASVIARAGAWLIDALLTAVLLVALGWFLAWLGAERFDFASAMATIIAVIVLVFIGTPMIVETATRGRSLGKLAFGLQVITDDGGPVRLRHTSVRALVGFFELWMLFGGLAFVVSMLNDRGKRVGDFLAGTYVARLRAAPVVSAPLFMPQALGGWAQLTDIRPLPDTLALRARQFLARAQQFPPPVRQRLGLRLAAQVEQYVAPSPPPQTHPEAFLMAVLFERRLREQRAADRSRPRVEKQLAEIDRLPFAVPDPES